MNLLSEIRRILKPGGKVRLTVPDLNFFIQLITKKSRDNRFFINWYFKNVIGEGWPKTPVTLLNWIFYGFGHRFMYSAEQLMEVLKENGFRKARAFPVGQSSTPQLVNVEYRQNTPPPIKRVRALETICIEAIKPAKAS